MRKRRNHFGSVGFAGLGRAIIKNNKSQTTKHRKKDKTVLSSRQTPFRNSKTTSKAQLEAIRSKIERDRKVMIKKVIVFVVTFLIIVAIIFYFLYDN